MKKSFYIALSLLTLTACNKSGSQSASDTQPLTLPVSEVKLCCDWYKTLSSMFIDEEENCEPAEYLLYDIDGDERAEVLMRNKHNCSAIFSYDANGRLVFADGSTDGYMTLGVGKGWYVIQHDDHMGEYRTWTTYYHKVHEGKFDFIGDVTLSLQGLDDEGEYIESTEDNTRGLAPADSLISYFYDLEGWLPISQEALDTYRDHLDDWNDYPVSGNDEATSVAEGNTDSDVQCIAAEFTLDNGMKGRLDMIVTSDSKITGWTTYYRKNGSTSKICFFGTTYNEEFIDNDVVELHEYYNGKCCGHFKYFLTLDGEFSHGSWYLRDRDNSIEQLTKVPFDEANQPVLASPATDATLADQLLPCSRNEIRERLLEEYDELPDDLRFMLYDMNRDGKYEIFLRYPIDQVYSHAVIWMNDKRPELICGGSTPMLMSINGNILYVVPQSTNEQVSPYTWTWVGNSPEMHILDEEESSFLEQSTHDLDQLGDWCRL